LSDQSPFGLSSLLNRMFILSPICTPNPVTLVGSVFVGVVDADNSDANGIATGTSELANLLRQITNHAIDLLDHRLCKNFHLGPDFDCGDQASANGETWYGDGDGIGDALAKSTIATSGINTAHRIASIYDPIMPLNSSCELL